MLARIFGFGKMTKSSQSAPPRPDYAAEVAVGL